MADANEPGAGIAAETVLGLDNVPLDLPLAGVGSRVLAAFVDYLLQFVVQIVWFFASRSARGAPWASRSAPSSSIFAGAFAIDWAYFAGFEVAMHGPDARQEVGGPARGHPGGRNRRERRRLLTRNLLRPSTCSSASR